jgi:hypothetical protein
MRKKKMAAVRAQERNKCTTSLVFAPVYGVTSTGTYPDTQRWMRLVDEHKSCAIRKMYRVAKYPIPRRIV